jgi:protein-disulfide isomerase
MNLFKMIFSTLALIAAATTAHAQVFIGGNPKAALTIEEYADFQCPYCSKGAKLIDHVLKDYPNQVRVVFRNRPLSNVHKHADCSAKAFLAVAKQNPALAKHFYDEIFAHQDELEARGEDYLYEAAARVGADVAKMKTDMVSAEVAKALSADVAEAERLQIDGVPSFMVGTEKVTGAVPYSELKKTIDQQLAH